jgi:hypothetical protein
VTKRTPLLGFPQGRGLVLSLTFVFTAGIFLGILLIRSFNLREKKWQRKNRLAE